jgi:hypothetical protein
MLLLAASCGKHGSHLDRLAGVRRHHHRC